MQPDSGTAARDIADARREVDEAKEAIRRAEAELTNARQKLAQVEEQGAASEERAAARTSVEKWLSILASREDCLALREERLTQLTATEQRLPRGTQRPSRAEAAPGGGGAAACKSHMHQGLQASMHPCTPLHASSCPSLCTSLQVSSSSSCYTVARS